MNNWILIVAVSAVLGSALVGGIFYAFSTFVMKALGCLPFQEGIRAMQSINIVVINPAFLGVFMGTAVASLVLASVSLTPLVESNSYWFLIGGLCYIVGTFGVTGIFNVPLNNQLASVSQSVAEGEVRWSHYLERWTFWNHIRTTASMASALLILVGLIKL
ncbi:DUF1772 domain-containing protein [Puniceicoccaceae bacterium K14]|nr:DUF1772 domain-containing protein [Puniceicoccaceae bacterium K14]